MLINGVKTGKKTSVIFAKDNDGNQVTGNKWGVFFIPYEFKDSEKVSFELSLTEYEDKNLTSIIDSMQAIHYPKHFKSVTYIDFESEPVITKVIRE